MVKHTTDSLSSVFSALADPTRRALLAQLSDGDSAISTLRTPRKMSLPGVMKHLAVLEGAGLVKKNKKGRVMYCRLAAEPMKLAASWIDEYRQFWDLQLDSLSNYLNADVKEGE